MEKETFPGKREPGRITRLRFYAYRCPGCNWEVKLPAPRLRPFCRKCHRPMSEE